MNNNHVKEIKTEDKKAFKGFVFLLIISLIIGLFTGFMSSNIKVLLNGSLPDLLIDILETISPFTSLLLSLFVIIVSRIIYIDARKKYDLFKDLDENEDIIEKVERKLGAVLLIVNINLILGYFFFGISSMLLPFDNSIGELSVLKFICSFVGLIVCISSSIIIQKDIINLEKENNPTLKGSIYDKNFSKKWIDSCDEAIKLGIYKCTYKAYTSVSTTCVILWLFCLIGYDIWNFGIMPMVMVIVIWLVQTISYSIESLKNGKRK